MNDTNIVVLSGRLSKDAENNVYGTNTKHTFSLAVNKSRKVGEEWKDEVCFFDVECWNKGGRAQYLTKGRKVLVEGELCTSRYEKDGRTVSRLFIKAENIQILDFSKTEGNAKTEAATTSGVVDSYTPNHTKPTVTPENFEDEDGDMDIPF